MARARRKQVSERLVELRQKFWPDVREVDLWDRKKSHGFATVPRTMPLIMSIMDDLAGGKRVSTAYLELWMRCFDECVVTLNNHGELAFHSGYNGQRAERTWRERIHTLSRLGFISVKSGPTGTYSYAVVFNPYHVIYRHYQQGTAELQESKYNALVQRATEIGAKDLEEKDALENSIPSLDDDIPF